MLKETFIIFRVRRRIRTSSDASKASNASQQYQLMYQTARCPRTVHGRNVQVGAEFNAPLDTI